MPPKIKDITFYQRKISVYRARHEHHKKTASNILYEIKKCNDIVRRIKKRETKIEYLINALIEYYGYHPTRNETALGAYFKYGMENGIGGVYLRKYVNIENHRTPGEKRKQFTQLIQKDKTANQQYHNFIKKMKQRCK